MKCDECGKDLPKPYATAPGLAWCKDCFIKVGQGINDQIRKRKSGEPFPDLGFDPRQVRILGGSEK